MLPFSFEGGGRYFEVLISSIEKKGPGVDHHPGGQFSPPRGEPIGGGRHNPKTMALPQSLRTSVTPPELELIASEQLIDIVPLVTMEKTAFISVSTLQSNLPLLSLGCLDVTTNHQHFLF